MPEENKPYVGHRPILPQQHADDWKRGSTGEAGVYSNWSLQSTTQLLEDVGHPDLPDHSEYNTRRRGWQVFTGEFEYNVMELDKWNHGGQRAPYLRHINFENHSVPSADVFAGDWGHDGTRELSTSRWSNHFFRGVESADMTLTGHPMRNAEDAPSGIGRENPYVNKGVTGNPMTDVPHVGVDSHYVKAEADNAYGWQRPNVWKGVTSAQAL